MRVPPLPRPPAYLCSFSFYTCTNRVRARVCPRPLRLSPAGHSALAVLPGAAFAPAPAEADDVDCDTLLVAHNGAAGGAVVAVRVGHGWGDVGPLCRQVALPPSHPALIASKPVLSTPLTHVEFVGAITALAATPSSTQAYAADEEGIVAFNGAACARLRWPDAPPRVRVSGMIAVNPASVPLAIARGLCDAVLIVAVGDTLVAVCVPRLTKARAASPLTLECTSVRLARVAGTPDLLWYHTPRAALMFVNRDSATLWELPLQQVCDPLLPLRAFVVLHVSLPPFLPALVASCFPC